MTLVVSTVGSLLKASALAFGCVVPEPPLLPAPRTATENVAAARMNSVPTVAMRACDRIEVRRRVFIGLDEWKFRSFRDDSLESSQMRSQMDVSNCSPIPRR